MKKLLVVLIVCLSPFMIGWTLSWDRVTQYTDGSTITDDNVVYDAWQDATQIANGITDNQVQNLNVQRGSTYTYKVRARLIRQGTASDNSVPFVWTWAAGKAGAPGQLRVVP